MKKLMMAVCFALSSLPCQAEVGSKEMTLAGINDCMKEAMNSSTVEDGGDAIILSCNAEKAKILFNFLGKKVRAEVVQDKNGKFENRAFGNNACYRRIEDSNGTPSNEFRCDLILVIGESLKE